jgi:hypothetical protein
MNDEEVFLEGMRRMTVEQREFMVRLMQRMAVDKAFALRAWREREILRALVRSEDYIALERWFARRRPELVRQGWGRTNGGNHG